MPRRKRVGLSRELSPDPVYGSELVQKLINVVMWRGKKSTARRIVYGALQVLTKQVHGDSERALELLSRAFEKIIPVVEVRPRRVGGSVYQVPAEVSINRGRSLALRWLITFAAARSDKSMDLRLAHEIMDAVEGRGGAIKKRNDVHKMAESNKAFSHYAW